MKDLILDMGKGTNENNKDQEETAAQDQVNTTEEHKKQQEDETIRTKKSSEPDKSEQRLRGFLSVIFLFFLCYQAS